MTLSINKLEPYVFATAAVGIAILARVPGYEVLGTASPYLLFVPAVVVTSYHRGLRAGLWATAASALAAIYLFVEPTFAFVVPRIEDVFALLYFVSVGVFVAWLSGRMRQAKRAVEEERRLSHQTLSSIGDGVIATDAAGRITFLNAVAEQLTGWSESEARGRTLDEVFVIRDETTGAISPNPAERALREGSIVGLANHTVVHSRGGRTCPIDDSAAPIRDETGAIRGAVLVFRDVTDRRAIEREIQSSREQLASTLESITDAFFALDQEWRFVYVNGAAAAVLHKPAAEILGQLYWDVFPYAERSEIGANLRATVADRVPRHFEFQSPRTHRWFEMHAYPGAERGLSVYFRDISLRKDVEAKLRDREQRLSRLAESNVIGIQFGDTHGNLRDANDEFLRMIGRTREELREGRIRWTDITPLEHLAADERAFEEAKARGSCTPYEKEYLRADGTRIPILVGYVLLGEERVESVAFVVDLTRQKKAEAELQQINDELQQFTYGASHDLKEPIRMVGAYAGLLERKLKDQLDDDSREFLRYINEGVRRMRSLVDALLEYSRAGEVRPTLVPVDTEAALRDSLMVLQPAINETEATVTSDPLPRVCAEPLHISRLFQNLISNAIRYRNSEPPRIHIGCISDGGICRFSVADNGVGIPREHQQRIFGLFQRLHGRETPGTGLGLATSKRIVERYGGRIWVESEGEGKGSVFRFTLPDGG